MHAFQRGQNIGFLDAGFQAHKAAYGEWQGGVEVQFLRHVTDTQTRFAFQRTFRWRNQPEYHAHQRGFARAVWAEQRQNTARLKAERNIRQHLTVTKGDGDIF